MAQQFRADVAVAGSGAGASAVAGELAAAGMDVLVVEAGPKWFDRLGTHVRNVYSSEADLSRVGDIIYGEMLGYPSGSSEPVGGMAELKVAHGAGGMFALWMGNCPYPDAGELPDWMGPADWKPYFDRALGLMHVDQNGGGSGRMFEALLDRTKTAVGPRPAGREVRPMPFAARRVDGTLKITASDDLFFRGGDQPPNLRIMTDCIIQEVTAGAHKATGLRGVRRTAPGERIEILADTIVIAGGTVGSPKILAGSKLDTGPALGRYIHEHVCIGSRVTLNEDIRKLIRDDEPVYSIWVPFSEGRPWQNQLCRFTLSSDGTRLAPGIREVDTSDIFTFVAMDVTPENRFIFDAERLDPFGLPDAGAAFGFTRGDRERIGAAMAEHFLIASEVGDMQRGWTPSIYPAGGSTHFMGSCRMGEKDDGQSVVDRYGKLWRYENIFVADNSVLGMSNAGNPTFTTVAQSLRTADRILGRAGPAIN